MASGSMFVGRKASARRAIDPDVRALLKEYLHHIHQGTDTRVLEEVGLCQGNVFMDVAVVNGELSGFEIKSPSDTLARWPRQRRYYSKVVDRAWLVAPVKALDRSNAPEWWGQIGVFEREDRLALRVVRPADLNPRLDPLSLARLLWRDEALDALAVAGRDRGVRTKSRRVIWRRLIETINLPELRAAVRHALKRRPERVALLKK